MVNNVIADPLSSTRIQKLHDCFWAGLPDKIKKVLVVSARLLDLHQIRRWSHVASWKQRLKDFFLMTSALQ